MNNVLTCPLCGTTEFIQCRTLVTELTVVASFSKNGVLLEERVAHSECLGEEDQESYRCRNCRLEIADDDGEPLIDPEDIAQFFRDFGEEE